MRGKERSEIFTIEFHECWITSIKKRDKCPTFGSVVTLTPNYEDYLNLHVSSSLLTMLVVTFVSFL